MKWLANLFKRKSNNTTLVADDSVKNLYDGFLAFQEGEKFYEKRRYEEALYYLDMAIENGFVEKSYELRAASLQELNYDFDAIDDFNKAIELVPDDCNLYFSRSLSKGAIGDFRGEVDDLNMAIELSKIENKRNSEHHINAKQIGHSNATSLYNSYLKIALLRLDSFLKDQQRISNASPQARALLKARRNKYEIKSNLRRNK